MTVNEKTFFVKSLEEDLATQRLIDGKKQPFQSLDEMCHPTNGEQPHIKPNTVSFGQAERLACTAISEQYTQTYRPQGIIFQTSTPPDYVAPFDLMVLANVPGENIRADYYSIVHELKEHYERALIPGYDKFLFKTPEEMLSAIPNPEIAWKMVNDFRNKHGLSPIPEAERKLLAYNEVIFYKTVAIKPVAIYGDVEQVPELLERAKKIRLPVYPSAEAFYQEQIEQTREQRQSLSIK